MKPPFAAIAVVLACTLSGAAHAERDGMINVLTNLTGQPLEQQFKRQTVDYRTNETPGTIVIDTSQKYLYFVLGNDEAIRYGIGVGRQGFTWSGIEHITRKAEWPDWHPPVEMVARDKLAAKWKDGMPGGPNNPLGARALYLGSSEYRIHGTYQPWTIGHNVSSGCIRLTNTDVIDLYGRAKIGGEVIVR